MPKHSSTTRGVRASGLFDYGLLELIERCRESQLAEQAIPDIPMEAPLASTSVQQSLPSKKMWIRTACDKCIEEKHRIKHEKIRGTVYRGKTHSCREKECRRMLSRLWRENFLRSDSCSHSNEVFLPATGSLVAESSANQHELTQTQASSSGFRNKSLKPRHTVRNSHGAFAKRTGDQSNCRITEQFADSNEGVGPLNTTSSLSEMVCIRSEIAIIYLKWADSK